MSAALVIMAGIGWLAGVGALMSKAIDAGYDHGRRRAWCLWLAALIVFAVPLGYAYEWDHAEDPRLCLRGHQEYVQRSSLVLVGKVFVPTTRTEKAWICDEWDR